MPAPECFSEFQQLLGRRARTWQLRSARLEAGALPLLMGILNVTPDSFSDGGAWLDPGRAVEHAWQLAEQGADLLDVGGESTRPYSQPVSPQEELHRVLPVLERLQKENYPLPISIDTSKALVAREAIAAGAQVVNDVTGLEGDPEMLPLVVETGVGVCAMHMQGTPQTMQDNPHYEDVVQEVANYLKRRRDALLRAGVPAANIALDPGIGFGKTHQHNLQLLQNSWRLLGLECPVLVGHSRKGFIAHVLGDRQRNRLQGTVGVSLALALQGVQILRVHDVQAVREALLLFQAAGGLACLEGSPTQTRSPGGA